MDYNGALTLGGGGVIVGLALWRALSRSKLLEARETGERSFLATILEESKATMQQRDAAVERAQVNFQLYIVEQRRVAELDAHITFQDGEIARLKEQLRSLAVMLVELRADARPFVQQWLRDSGYPPL